MFFLYRHKPTTFLSKKPVHHHGIFCFFGLFSYPVILAATKAVTPIGAWARTYANGCKRNGILQQPVLV